MVNCGRIDSPRGGFRGACSPQLHGRCQGVGMPFQTWGTFSVADHLGPRAFVADLVLYDRLVIPVPDAEERKRWADLGRRPDVLDRKLDILEEFADGPEDSPVVRLDW